MLEPKERVADDKFFTHYRSCVVLNRNAQESAELRAEMDLSLKELQEQGQGRDIFPPRAYFALRSGIFSASVINLRSQWAASAAPKS